MKILPGQVWIRKSDAELFVIISATGDVAESFKMYHEYIGELEGTTCDCKSCEGVNYDR